MVRTNVNDPATPLTTRCPIRLPPPNVVGKLWFGSALDSWSGPEETISVNSRLASCGGNVWSVTLTVNVNEPKVTGIPNRHPLGLNVSQDGGDPPAILQNSGPLPPTAERQLLRNSNRKPSSSAVVAILRRGASLIDSSRVAVWPIASTARTVNVKKLNVPVGVPEMRPLGLRTRPGGSVPFAIVHETGATPVAVSISSYGSPIGACGNE